MSCAACSARVQQACSAVEGVAVATVNLLKNSMEIEYAEGASEEAVAAAICEAVSKAGYGASPRGIGGAGAEGVADTYDIAEAQRATSERRAAEEKSMRFRLIVSLVFGIPLFYLCMGHMFGWPVPLDHHNPDQILPFALAQIVLLIPIVVVNRSYFTRGFKTMLHGAPNMDSLIALGATASILYSLYGVFVAVTSLGAGNTEAAHHAASNLYFDSAGMILALITLGKYFEARAKGKTTSAIEGLIDLSPKTAIIQRDGAEVEIPASEVNTGDICVIRAGAAIPCDGVVIEGTGSVDESALTGESVPVDKTEGSVLTGATVNQTGWMLMRATRVGNETSLAQIIRLVDEATSSKAPIERMADKIARIFVPVVIGIALLTFIVWLVIGGGIEAAINHAITVLVISCPCALGLATPTAIMVGTGQGARHGILIKSAEALETAHDTTMVVFDKTGTITQGAPQVTVVQPASNISEEDLLVAAFAIEKRSEHSLARAIVNYAEQQIPQRTSELENIDYGAFNQVPGKGLEVEIEGMSYFAGNARLMEAHGVELGELASHAEQLAEEGTTPLFFAEENTLLGIIALADLPKETSAEAIVQLSDMGIRSVMLTGDNARTANAIAKQVGIQRVIADVLPQDKESHIRRLAADSTTVAMVGDGINDAPALVRADVGIAVGSGTDVALDSADVVLVRNDLRDVPAAIQLSRTTLRNIRQNLFWALFYNVICIPVAAGVLTPLGITLNPMIAAAAMSLSSLFVVANALRLRTWKPSK